MQSPRGDGNNQNTDEYVCVDGLQRTTALQRFVNGEIKVFDQYYDDFGFTNMIAKFNPLPEFKLNVYINHLESKREILEWYIAMNSGGTPHSKDEIDRVKNMLAESLNLRTMNDFEIVMPATRKIIK